MYTTRKKCGCSLVCKKISIQFNNSADTYYHTIINFTGLTRPRSFNHTVRLVIEKCNNFFFFFVSVKLGLVDHDASDAKSQDLVFYSNVFVSLQVYYIMVHILQLKRITLIINMY